MDTAAFADEMSNTPLSAYQRAAAGEMGVDPYYAMGTWGDKTDLAQWKLQRDLESIGSTGMPYSEYATEVDQLASQRATENLRQQSSYEKQLGDTTAADEKAAQDMIAQEIYNRTGVDAGSFQADPINVLDVLSNPAYVEANNLMLTAQGAGDEGKVFDAYKAAADDPAVLDVFLTQWKDYLPSDIETQLYG